MFLQTVMSVNKDITTFELENTTEVRNPTIEIGKVKGTVYLNNLSLHTITPVDAQIKTYEKWNSLLLEHNVLSSDTTTFKDLSEKLNSAINCIDPDDFFIESIKNAISIYNEDRCESIKNQFNEYSINSLKQFTRYIPDFKSLYYNVYIDKESGFFGLILKSSKKAKPILNLLLQENGEITYSFIERKKGIIKISGRAYFNNNLDDSCQIKHLIRMIKP